MMMVKKEFHEFSADKTLFNDERDGIDRNQTRKIVFHRTICTYYIMAQYSFVVNRVDEHDIHSLSQSAANRQRNVY